MIAATRTLTYQAIDVDNHYYETDDCFTRHIDPKFRDDALHLLSGKEPARKWVVRDRLVTFMPFNALDQTVAPGALQRFFSGTDTKRSLSDDDYIRPGDIPELYRKAERVMLMDEQNLEAVIMLPTVGVLVEPDLEDIPDVLTANYSSFNRWVEDEWGYGSDGRVFGVPMISLVDIDWAIAELHRVVGLGAKFIYMRTGPVQGFSPGLPRFDKFWAEVERTGVRVILHVGNAGFAAMYSTQWGEPSDVPLMRYSAFQQYTCVVERPIGDTLAAMILHNLFGRFPGIEVLSIENGSSWVAPLLKGMDKAAKMSSAMGLTPGGPLTALPSETFRRNIYVAPFHEDDIVGLADLIGADRVLFGSDYPHAEGLTKPMDFTAALDSLNEEQVRIVMRSNAAGLMDLTR
jgi:predicted TIM-barrel fold metal-dependent hydrolase